MNRNILTIIGIMSSIFVMTNKANACTNETPIAGIVSPFEQYVGVYESGYEDISWGRIAFFDSSGSYDPDNGTPQGENNGITACEWKIYMWNDYYEDYIYCDSYNYTYLYYYFTEPGLYMLKLYVWGDDGEGDDDKCSEDDIDCCYVVVFDATISSESSSAAYGTGKDFTYDVKPDIRIPPHLPASSYWVPDYVVFYITDNWNNSDYYSTYLSTVIIEEPTINWNGKDDDENWLVPGEYFAVLSTWTWNDFSDFWADYWGDSQYYGWYSTYFASTQSFSFDVLDDVTLTKCSSSFIPKGGEEDNTTTFTATIAGGNTGIIKFTLYDVSDEPGYCMNKPSSIPTGNVEDSDSWKDLRFLSQTGFTISGSNDEVATTTSSVSSATVTVTSNDYGAYGKIKAQAQINGVWYNAHIANETTTFARIPLDVNNADNEPYISAAWQYHGKYSDDADTSANNTHDGDSLTRYEEYRGVDFDGDGKISSSERLNPDKKDFFIQTSGFNDPNFPSFSYGNAFADAGIEVHIFSGNITTEPNDARNIDVLPFFATNSPYISWTDNGHIKRGNSPNVYGVRQWTFDTLAWSTYGSTSIYGVALCYKTSVNYYFSDKPYKDNNTWTSNGVWGGSANSVLDPIAKVEDTNDNGVLDGNEKDGNTTSPYDDGDNDFDGDYPVKSGSFWDYNQDLSPRDINKNGLVELPGYAQVPVSSYDEYTKAQVVQQAVTHEMGHAVGINGSYGGHCDDDTCLMYRISINWSRDGHFCNDCKAMILIHNN
jgi:hypothetical protein